MNILPHRTNPLKPEVNLIYLKTISYLAENNASTLKRTIH